MRSIGAKVKQCDSPRFAKVRAPAKDERQLAILTNYGIVDESAERTLSRGIRPETT